MRRDTRGSVKVKAAFLALSLCAPPFVAPRASAAQERRPPVRRDAAALRRALAGAVGGEFEIVRDELTRRSAYHGGGAYWLAHVRPKRPGSFTLKYAYGYEDPFTKGETSATRAEHSFHINVGPRGCWRRPAHMASRFEPCLGDTIILPFALDAYRRVYAGHTFEFAARPAAARDAPAGPEAWELTLLRQQDAKLRRDEVVNPLAEHLKYLGSTAEVRLHRAPGYTAEYHATFEAVRPGRFNLLLGAGPPGADGGAAGVPVIIVERGTPVTWLAAHESVSEFVGRFSSHAGNSYLTSPVIMQPGERLTLRYDGYTRRGPRAETDRGGGAEENHRPPVITRLPFRVNPDESFNEWLVEHLPKGN
ncbi:MAG TPA: hypothetical protein VN228_11070 [Pyrinomonadaceae bacterium]|nr:hypothetical protein [Pyrinomonadaceae bacterium]